MKIAVRGFAGRHRVFEETVEVPDDFSEEFMYGIVSRHAGKMMPYPEHMMEIEFLDDPGEDRFFRFGTDPSGMVMELVVGPLCPVEVKDDAR